jgi:hypothetical protein
MKTISPRIELSVPVEDPRSGVSLVPMLVIGLVLLVVGMAIAMLAT